MNDKPTVFISYRQKISGFAARGINDGLQAMGLKVFFDADGIHLGDNWQAQLEKNLLESEYLVVILAPTTLESEWVRKEVEFALQHGKSVIPIFTDGLANLYDVDFRQFPEQIAALRDIQGIDYNYKRPKPTFDELKIVLNVSSSANPSPSTEQSASKGSPILGLISAVAVVLGLVFAFVALFPEQTRTDWFRSIGLLPTLTVVPSPTVNVAASGTATESTQLDITATELMLKGTEDANQTATAVLVAESTHLIETAKAVPTATLTIKPSDTAPPPTSASTPTVVPPSNTATQQSSTATLAPTDLSPATATSEIPAIEIINGYAYVLVPARPFSDLHGNANTEFRIGAYEVTNLQFASFLNARGSNLSADGKLLFNDRGNGTKIARSGGSWRIESGYENHPAVRVTWYGARDYCAYIGGRLPTATEWHKSAAWNPTNGSIYLYPWGNSLPSDDLVNFNGVSGGTVAVDTLVSGSSPVGAFNMAGNVSEWIADTQGINRMRMGGGWDSGTAQLLTDAIETSADTFSTASTGIRCAH